jgi:hypothetical protein
MLRIWNDDVECQNGGAKEFAHWGLRVVPGAGGKSRIARYEIGREPGRTLAMMVMANGIKAWYW